MDRVLEVGGVAAGYCGQLFAQAGHEVVRVEQPALAPGWVSPEALDLLLHRGKHRVDDVTPAGLAELAAAADVVVLEAPTADAALALGLDQWEAPVRVAVTPFGRTGPRRNEPATPATLLARGGVTAVMGDPGRAPLTLAGHLVELQAGTLAYTAASACRLAGRAEAIDVAMLEVVLSQSQYGDVQWHCTGEIQRRGGNRAASVAPADLFACADGLVYVHGAPIFWDAFTVFLDRPELLLDERFTTPHSRLVHRDALHAILEAVLADQTRGELLAKADRCGVPLGVVRSLEEVLADPQLEACDAWQRVARDGVGTVRLPRPVGRLLEPVPHTRSTPVGDRERVHRAGGPLGGVRILDLTHVWAGPLATRVLADLGADVVKVETPRARGPRDFGGAVPVGGFLGGEPGGEPWNAGAAFAKQQRNKRSVSLDLDDEAGRSALLDLVAAADVVIENRRPGALAALGIDAGRLHALDPRLVVVAMPAYGTRGPARDRVAFGPTVEPMAGLTHVVGYGEDEPRNSTLALPDPVAGFQAAAAVLTALGRRERTGMGGRVEVSLHEAALSLTAPFLVAHQLGSVPRRMGNRHPALAPSGVYAARGSDDWVAIACRNDAEWRALCDVAGFDAELAGLGLAGRRARHDVIDVAISRWTADRDKRATAQALSAAGVPAGPVQTAPETMADDQVVSRGFFVPLDHGTPMPGSPVHMGGISPSQWTPCPRLGGDNREVLRTWLDYDDGRIDALEAAGVLVDAPPD